MTPQQMEQRLKDQIIWDLQQQDLPQSLIPELVPAFMPLYIANAIAAYNKLIDKALAIAAGEGLTPEWRDAQTQYIIPGFERRLKLLEALKRTYS